MGKRLTAYAYFVDPVKFPTCTNVRKSFNFLWRRTRMVNESLIVQLSIVSEARLCLVFSFDQYLLRNCERRFLWFYSISSILEV